MVNRDGDRIKYTSKNGEKNGFGEFSSDDGIFYKGEYKDGVFNGEGTYSWADGRKLVGKFKNGAFWEGEVYNKLGKINFKVSEN